MGMDNWRTPDAVRGGVDIPLPDSDVIFRVRLPSKHNKAFTRAVQAGLFKDATVTAIGTVEMGTVDVAGLRDMRMGAFADTCLIMPLPEGMTVATLRDEYQPAFEWLFDEAERLATELDKQGESVKKKSKAS